MAKLTRNQTAAAILAHLKTPHAAPPPTVSKAIPVQPAPRLHPWFCRYDATAAAVLIYLPAESVAGYTLDPSAQVPHGTLPDFYLVPFIDTGTGSSSSGSFPSWKVVVSLTVSGTTVTPTFYQTGADIPDGAIVIAETTEDGLARPVRQYVTGAISLGGGGIEQTLGPLEYEKKNNRIAQYMGTWALTPATGTDPASWTFVKATDSEGNTLPPAAVYNTPSCEFLVRMHDGTNYAVGRITLPTLFPNDQTQIKWLSRQTAAMVHHAAYTAPGDEYGTGGLTATNATITYFAEVGQQSGGTEVLLHTITEDAQTADTYESDTEE